MGSTFKLTWHRMVLQITLLEYCWVQYYFIIIYTETVPSGTMPRPHCSGSTTAAAHWSKSLTMLCHAVFPNPFQFYFKGLHELPRRAQQGSGVSCFPFAFIKWEADQCNSHLQQPQRLGRLGVKGTPNPLPHHPHHLLLMPTTLAYFTVLPALWTQHTSK